MLRRKYGRYGKCDDEGMSYKRQFEDCSLGDKVRLMVRGACLLLRGSRMIIRKYIRMSIMGVDNWKQRSMFECNRYGYERERWRGLMKRLNNGICEYEV